MTKPIALDDLTKDELIQLVRERFPFFTQADLLRAQWDASMARWKHLEAEATAARAPVADLAAAVGHAKTAAERVKAFDRYTRASKAADAATAKADREWNRGEAINARLMTANETPRRRRA